MTPFKENITKSIDNLNQLQKDVDETITDLQKQIEEMENLETKEVTITTNTETTIEPTTGKYALEKVVVTTNVQPNLEEKSVTITENTTTNITPSSGYDGISSVAVTTNIPQPPSITISDCRRLFYNKYRFSDMLTILPLCKNITYTEECFYNAFTGQTFDADHKLAIENLSVDSNCVRLNSLFYNAFNYYTTPRARLDLTSWDTQNVTNFNSCFNQNNSLEFIDISTWDFSSVNNGGLENFVYNCMYLDNDTLHNIIIALLTAPTTYNTKTLAHIGINATQATTCTSFEEWATLSADGWTTGY